MAISVRNHYLYLWSEETIERRAAEPSSHLPLSEAGIWADCIRTKRPAIHNDYPDLESKNGLPEGHFPLQRHMSIPIVDKKKIVAIIGVGDKPHPYSEDDARQLSLFGGSMWTIIFGHRKDALLKKSLTQTIQAFAMTLEQRDPYTAGHQRRVADLSCAIARELGLEQDMIEGIGIGGIIHDLGKISVPAEILNSPGKLSEPELAIIKLHPEVVDSCVRLFTEKGYSLDINR